VEPRRELALKQVQKLIMTPKLRQALALLQMPLLELELLLRQELSANPVLEELLEEEGDSSLQVEEAAPEEAETPDRVKEEEVDWAEYFREAFEAGYNEPAAQRDEWIERVVATQPTFESQLLSQLRLMPLDDRSMEMAEYLVASLDEDGYLRSVDVDDVAREFGVESAMVEEILGRLQQELDPPGIGARNLRECLVIQLQRNGRREGLAWEIILGHLEDLERKRFPKIAKELGVTLENVKDAAEEIATLDPKPGLRVVRGEPRHVIPDLVVERVEDEYIVLLNDRNLPRIRINPTYRDMVTGVRPVDDKDRQYLVDKLNSAKWLIRSIEQRRRTLSRVTSYIMHVQRDFLDKGAEHLRPLTLQQVADALEIHESTVSRVVTGKYVQTPRGVFELRYFFGGGLKTSSGEDMSVKVAKERIRRMIEQEDTDSPITDEEIAGRLRAAGLRIARRTVGKYRDQMGILPAKLRKYG
jgi:RNA polymerase sigma-54 factor